MYYAIRHVTTFRYSAPISESMMEVRMQPRSEGRQRCLSFHMQTTPRAFITAYTDDLGNRTHHFDVPDRHTDLAITVKTLMEVLPPPLLPERLSDDAWGELDRMTATDEYWDMLAPSRFAHPTDLLRALAAELDVRRGDDPLHTVHDLCGAIHESIRYVPQVTTADSPIDDALRTRQGVCQDYAHIMIALVRGLGVPCRYVSGYLYHRETPPERLADGATHAWVEALLPQLGWVGFDPTNNRVAGERHIRVAVGRDYNDVPPTHGVFKGNAESELSVSVQVTPSDTPPVDTEAVPEMNWAMSAYGGQQ